MTVPATISIDGRPVSIGTARNLLEAVRADGGDLPTFCYHSALSAQGACRLCVVEVEGRGTVAACSTPPEPGMAVRTRSDRLRRLRRTGVELLLAAHRMDCPSCVRAGDCRLQEVARLVGVDRVRFESVAREAPIDTSSAAVVRDPGRCILCGDCVRACGEIQGVGALDFAGRGAATSVQPAFGKGLGEVDCTGCGQCVQVCPTAALAPAPAGERVWRLLGDPRLAVVVQVAPAVRAAIGECFGLPPGPDTTGRMFAALRRLGFARVYDTAFAADLTVWEEGAKFVRRLEGGGPLPLLTSCCPAWVRLVEHAHPEALPLLSTCRSPQQMFGALARRTLPGLLGVAPECLAVVAVMPCTAKKAEAALPGYRTGPRPDVEAVLTTDELAAMIRAAGIDLARLAPEGADRPFGAPSGAGVLFGSSGGVAEAVLRYADAALGDGLRRDQPWEALRGGDGLRTVAAVLGGRVVRAGVVSGLGEAARVRAAGPARRLQLDLLEVMACPGGCVAGAGQPRRGDRARRAAALQQADAEADRRNSADNADVRLAYDATLSEPGSAEAHRLLHTSHQHRRRLDGLDLLLTSGKSGDRQRATVCVGTSCHLRGAQDLLRGLVAAVDARGWGDRVDVRATFCLERCACGPSVHLEREHLERASLESAIAAIARGLGGEAAP